MEISASNNATIRKVAIASFIGTAIEWFDFFIFNAAAILVFPTLFFPGDVPLIGTLKVSGIFAVGFIARPIGGIVCGHFGDRVGRKHMLVLTLLITGIATFLIGLLPGYQRIGIWAPILLLLLRFAQGFGIGGEWGGAVLMAIEHAPKGKRGFYGSWPQIGVPVGLFISTVIFALIPDSVLLDWAWRVPFLASILLVGMGLYIRISVAETPLFNSANRSKVPVLDALRRHPKNTILAMGARVAENGTFYLYTAFILIFTQEKFKSLKLYSRPQMLIAISIAAVLVIVALPIYAWMSDRIGRKPIYLFGAIFTGLFVFPFFWMIESARPSLMVLAVVLGLVLGWAAMYAPQASFFSELFTTQVRYSGASLGAQVATIFAGGLAPLIATGLLERTGNTWPISLYVIGMAVVTTVSVFLAAETAHNDISG